MEGIGDLANSRRIKGSSYIVFDQAKSYGLSSPYLISNVPLCGNLYLTSLHCKLLASLHVLVLYQVCVYICCALYLLILCIQACVGSLTHHVLVCFVEPISSCLYLSWLF